MPRQKQANKAGFPLLHHLGCGLLVIAFVHLFGLYQLVSQRLGGGFLKIAPLVLPALFVAVIILRRQRSGKNLPPIRRLPVLLGLCCALGALAIPDPEIAVKRIHVAEYLLLSLYVRYALSFRLRGNALLVFSCLLSCLYGVHDELLQGLHPARTYGQRDMLVNGISAVGGSLAWHGLGLFSERAAIEATGAAKWPRSGVLYTIGLAAAVPAMAIPLIAHRHDALPVWPFLPLAAAMVVWSCGLTDDGSTLRHGLQPASVVAFLFLFYPLAVNGLQIIFN